MSARALAIAMMQLGARSLREHVLGDPVLERRHAFAVTRRGGLWCFSSRLQAEVFNHVSGYGTFGPASQGAIDAVLRHYESIGGTARFEVLRPLVSRSDVRLLERNGFRDGGVLFQCHLRTTVRPPRVHAIDGFAVERATSRTATRYSKLATRGFGGGGTIADIFERGWTRQIKTGRRVSAFIGSVNGKPAATGVLYRGPLISGLYSGSVLRAYRGRGIQNAMIAARLRYGWAHGIRSFYSWSDPDSSSAENLRDEGFRTRFELHIFRRDD
jgi:hypothetical protein